MGEFLDVFAILEFGGVVRCSVVCLGLKAAGGLQSSGIDWSSSRMPSAWRDQ